MKKIRSLAVASVFALAALRAGAAVITESFTNDPALDGWRAFGDTNLFQWAATNQVLAVTWDSAQPNSYFYHPLGATLSRTNNFMLAFTFQLHDIAAGLEPDYPQSLQIAIGLLNFAEATNDGFTISTGWQAPDLVEFDYFPAFDIYNSSVTTPIISSLNAFANIGFTFPLVLAPGAQYRAEMTYTADTTTLHTTLTSNGVPVGPIQDTTLPDSFDDFSVDTFSINSYSQAGQDTSVHTNSDGTTIIYAGSVLAHGTVGKMSFGNPLPVTQILHFAPGGIQFSSTTNWVYTLERTADLQTWTGVTPPTPGAAEAMTLTDTNPPSAQAFYRVRVDLP
jgi:hypothetical protein